jgi:hypothetical protein
MQLTASSLVWCCARKAGYAVHLDECSEVAVTAHMIAADVVVDSRSSFAYNAALFGLAYGNCVVHQAWSKSKPQQHDRWITVRGRMGKGPFSKKGGDHGDCDQDDG